MDCLVNYGSSSEETEDDEEETFQNCPISSLAHTLQLLNKKHVKEIKTKIPAEEMKELNMKEEIKPVVNKINQEKNTVKFFGPQKPDRILKQNLKEVEIKLENHVNNESENNKQENSERILNDKTQTINTSECSNVEFNLPDENSNKSSPENTSENIQNKVQKENYQSVKNKDNESSEDSETSSSGDEESESEEDNIGPPIPTNLITEVNDVDDSELIGPPIPVIDNESDLVGPPIPTNVVIDTKGNPSHDSDSDEDNDEDGDVEDEDTKKFAVPLGKDITFKHGTKAITGLAIDPAGARLASGAVDYEVKFWDFAGMDSSLHSFRSLYPCGNNPIKCIEYSCTGDTVLIVSGMSQAKIFDRDGIEKLECVKGDQYIADLARTKGHTSPLTSGIWHPYLRHEFMTTSEDSTCRLWDVSRGSHHKNIMKCKTKNGLKTVPTVCAYSRDGNLVACACMDGSIQMWDHRKMFVNTTKLLRNAHQDGAEISGLQFSYHGDMFCTRACDDTLKLWDLRHLRSPIHTASNLFSRYGSTSCTFSPNDALIMTGASVNKGEPDGKLNIFKTATFEKLKEFSIPNSHIIKTIWHPRLNQIFIGCGDGSVKIFYDEEKSARGAKLFIGKKKTKKRQADVVFAASQPIITPHSLPLFRQEKPKPLHKKLEKERLDPVKSHRPDLPIKSGQGGRVAASGSTLSSYVIRNLGLSKRVEDDQDPREAILRFAEDAAKNPYWIAPAYAKTQPHAIFKDEEAEEDESESKKPRLV